MDRFFEDASTSSPVLEVIEESLQRGRATCVAFNRNGTLLATGTASGVVEIWDFETRAVARELVDERTLQENEDTNEETHDFGNQKQAGPGAVLSVNWSGNGRRLLAAYADGSVTVWDVQENDTVFRAVLDAPLHDARYSPNSNSLALVAPSDDSPATFALNRGRKRTPLPQMPGTLDVPSLVCRIPTNGLQGDTNVVKSPGHAIFSKSGKHAFVAGARGVITVVETATADIVQACKVPDALVIKRLELSKCGKFLLAVSNARAVRSFCVNEDANLGATNVSNSVPKKSPATNNAFAVEEDEDEPGGGAQNSESEKEEPKGVLTPSTVFQNEHSRGQWSCASFSHDAQCVVAASGGGAHELHVWARDTGTVIRVAVGAEASKGVCQIATHPHKCVFVVLGSNGMMYVWSSVHDEKWSAFEPGFVELDDNEEYVEREDEFDVPVCGDLARDTGDVSGSVTKALGAPTIVAAGAAVEAAVRVARAEHAVRMELEEMELAEARAEADALAAAAAQTRGAKTEQAEGVKIETADGVFAQTFPKPTPRPFGETSPVVASGGAIVVAVVETGGEPRVPLVGEGAALSLNSQELVTHQKHEFRGEEGTALGGEDTAPTAQPVSRIRVADQSAVLTLIGKLREPRSAAACCAATEAEQTSLTKSHALRNARRLAVEATALEAFAKQSLAALRQTDPESEDVDIYTLRSSVSETDNDTMGGNDDGYMHYLPINLVSDPEASVVIATRVARWREREVRVAGEAEKMKTTSADQATADEDARTGPKTDAPYQTPMAVDDIDDPEDVLMDPLVGEKRVREDLMDA